MKKLFLILFAAALLLPGCTEGDQLSDDGGNTTTDGNGTTNGTDDSENQETTGDNNVVIDPADPADPYDSRISNKAELIAFRNAVNNGEVELHAILENNIYLNGEAWTPIGTSSMPYVGLFEGDGYTIYDLTIEDANSEYQGLFGYVDGACISNITLDNPKISSSMYYTGAICGYVKSGSISGCGVVGGSVSGTNYVGGVVGSNYGTISDSYNTSEVRGTSPTGGVSGNNIDGGVISGCYNAGYVYASGNNVGGIVGYNNKSQIINCYNKGEILCDYDGTYSYIGGLIGYNYYSSSNTSCYNIGVVSSEKTSSPSISGAIGNSIGSVSVCYYNSDIFTGSTNFGEGWKTSNMKDSSFVSTLNSGQVSEPWKSDYSGEQSINDGYPILSWQLADSTD